MGLKGGSNQVEETEAQRAMAQIAADEYATSQRIMGPVEDFLVSEVQDKDGRLSEMLGISNVDTQIQFGEQKKAVDRARGSSRTGMGSGADMAISGDFSTAKGESLGLGASDAAMQADNDYLAGLDSLATYGSGEAGRAVAGTAESAARSGRQAISDAEYAARRSAHRASTAGAAAGVGAGIYTARNPNVGGVGLQPTGTQPAVDFGTGQVNGSLFDVDYNSPFGG